MSIDKNLNRIPVISYIAYVLHDSIDQINIYNNDRFTKRIILKTNKAPDEIYFTPGSAVFEEKDKQDDAGMLYEQSLKFFFPGEDTDNAALLDAIRNRPLIIVFYYTDGTMKFFGCIENGARFSKSSKIEAKNSGSEFSFSCISQEPAWGLQYIGEAQPS